MPVHRKFTVLFACLLALAGCNREGSVFLAETDEPNYKAGQSLMRQGRTPEALLAYQKVIAKRGDAAPESHLEAGIICFQNIKDPYAAIYHFREYLRLQPSSRQAALVKGQIEAAQRDLARTLPLSPMEGTPIVRSELAEQLEKLQRENDALKAELASRSDSGPSAPLRIVRAPTEPDPTPATPESSTPRIFISTGPQSQPAVTEAPPPIALAPAPAPTANNNFRPTPTPPKPTTAKPSRTYTTTAGDTLYGIMRKVYGSADNAKKRALLDANRDALPNGESSLLRPGIQLRVP